MHSAVCFNYMITTTQRRAFIILCSLSLLISSCKSVDLIWADRFHLGDKRGHCCHRRLEKTNSSRQTNIFDRHKSSPRDSHISLALGLFIAQSREIRVVIIQKYPINNFKMWLCSNIGKYSNKSRAKGCTAGIRFTAGDIFFPSPQRPDLRWGPRSLLSNGYHGLTPGVKRPGRKADHSPPFSA
jgi:hypothetical protein